MCHAQHVGEGDGFLEGLFYLMTKCVRDRCARSNYSRSAFMYYDRLDLTNMQMTCNYYLTWKAYRNDPILDSGGRRVIL